MWKAGSADKNGCRTGFRTTLLVDWFGVLVVHARSKVEHVLAVLLNVVGVDHCSWEEEEQRHGNVVLVEVVADIVGSIQDIFGFNSGRKIDPQVVERRDLPEAPTGSTGNGANTVLNPPRV